jgi:hypothetical protein
MRMSPGRARATSCSPSRCRDDGRPTTGWPRWPAQHQRQARPEQRAPAGRAHSAAVTTISIFHSVGQSRLHGGARRGVAGRHPGVPDFVHGGKSARSARKICAIRMRALVGAGFAEQPSMRPAPARLAADVLRGVVGHLAGEVDGRCARPSPTGGRRRRSGEPCARFMAWLRATRRGASRGGGCARAPGHDACLTPCFAAAAAVVAFCPSLLSVPLSSLRMLRCGARSAAGSSPRPRHDRPGRPRSAAGRTARTAADTMAASDE